MTETSAASARPGWKPFLSVVITTQGQDAELLLDLLPCFDGQTCQDFELLLVCENGNRQQRRVQDAVHDLAQSFRPRVRIFSTDGDQPARQFNAGIVEATGRYVSFLGQDDLVMGHWVQAFADLANTQPGRVLRTLVAEQDYRNTQWPGGVGFTPSSGRSCPYPSDFDLVEQLVGRQPGCQGWRSPVSVSPTWPCDSTRRCRRTPTGTYCSGLCSPAA